ncbi:Crp/Fnr family transcriptional regulator [Phenylobacterium sp.]|jgi:CRP-like cAMP-binding protein|uniref:Crp/Fnr family transcriptional regulator n=1 Tax=Phenylobacterium sp. TaxID=1871053 RepID=UPI002F933A86
MTTRLADLPEHARLISRLQTAVDLPPTAIQALLSLPVILQQFGKGEDIVRERERPTHVCLLLDGLGCRYRKVEPGSRQILAFHIAGDILDLQSLHLSQTDHALATLTPTRVAFIPHEDLRQLVYSNPAVCHVLWRETLVDAAVYREWLWAIGQLGSYPRIARLICELFVKHQLAGLVQGQSFRLPLTQVDFADALGLTAVHVSRVLRELRREGLLQVRGGTVTILDWRRTAEAGLFDPTYLHTTQAQAA